LAVGGADELVVGLVDHDQHIVRPAFTISPMRQQACSPCRVVGLQTMSILVRGPTAAAIATRSWPKSTSRHRASYGFVKQQMSLYTTTTVGEHNLVAPLQ